MEDVHKIGGIPALLKYLIKHTNLIDGSQMTVTGKTLAENLEDVPELDFETQDVIRRVENPIKPTGHLTILRGSLAPGTAVAKLTGKEGLRFEVRLCVLYDPGPVAESKMTGCCQMLRQVNYIPVPRYDLNLLPVCKISIPLSKRERLSQALSLSSDTKARREHLGCPRFVILSAYSTFS